MSNSALQVGILLAAYNGMDFLEEQIKSILLQKGLDVTIFISVDLSSDSTYEWCKELEEVNKNVTILSHGEKFGGAAPNFFRLIKEVDFAAFDYVALSDQDDIWLEDKLITACNCIEQMGVDAYSSNVLAFWDDGREQLIDKSQPQRNYDYLFESAGPGCTYVMRIKPLLEFKQMMVNYRQQIISVALHDWLLYAFFRASGYKWFIDSNYKMHYRQHAHNQVGINNGLQAALKRIKLVKNGWYKEQVVIVSSLVGNDGISVNSKWSVLKNISQLRRRFRDGLMLFFMVLVGLY